MVQPVTYKGDPAPLNLSQYIRLKGISGSATVINLDTEIEAEQLGEQPDSYRDYLLPKPALLHHAFFLSFAAMVIDLRYCKLESTLELLRPCLRMGSMLHALHSQS